MENDATKEKKKEQLRETICSGKEEEKVKASREVERWNKGPEYEEGRKLCKRKKKVGIKKKKRWRKEVARKPCLDYIKNEIDEYKI